MTIATLRKLLRLADQHHLGNDVRIVTRSDYLHGPEGIYDLPTQTQLVYIYCAMGGCSWRKHPAPHYKAAIYWDGN